MADKAKWLGRFPVIGRVEWIGIRPGYKQAMRALTDARLITRRGIEGDHHAAKENASNSRRQVTLIQQESFAAIQSFLNLSQISPEMLRRNIVVSGINLLALVEKEFSIGGVVLEGTGQCHPCGRMEETLGYGGYNAVKGYGGINAVVINGGDIRVGDSVRVE